jgi:hypothetical protein
VITDYVLIQWEAPVSNGSPITAYRIKLRQNDELTFTEDLVNCDGSQTVILEATQCTVPLSALTSAPYSLGFGDSIYAKVTAINYYGDSMESTQGNGGVIVLVPDPPINLRDNTATTTAYVIGLIWEDASSTGGQPIIDYKVTYDQSTGVDITLVEFVSL